MVSPKMCINLKNCANEQEMRQCSINHGQRGEIKCAVMNIFYFCDEFSHSPRETL